MLQHQNAGRSDKNGKEQIERKDKAIFQERQVLQKHPSHAMMKAEMKPGSIMPEDMLTLQRALGNQAVLQLLSGINRNSSGHVAQMALDKVTNQQYVQKVYDDYIGGVMSTHTNGVTITTPLLELRYLRPSDEEYEDLQDAGDEHGCWQCGVKMEDGEGSNWVADHVPPVNLNRKVLKVLRLLKYINLDQSMGFGPWTLKPQCRDCSSKQASVVKSLNKMTMHSEIGKAVRNNIDLIIGNKHDTKSVETSNRTTADSPGWKSDEARVRCHSCGKWWPTSGKTPYVADHFPPKEFNTPYAKALFEKAGLVLPAPKLMPQCYKCSSAQGGLTAASQRLIQIARDENITVYK